MTTPTAQPVATFLLRSHAACVAAGLLLGQAVMALAARQADSLAALVMCLCGGASVALLMGHLHAARWAGARPMPMQSWLLCLCAGALATMGLHAAL